MNSFYSKNKAIIFLLLYTESKIIPSMRSHKYRYSIKKWMKQKKWEPFKYHKKGKKYSNLLPSWNYENQTWGALHKAWVGYWIAQDKFEWDREIYYARVIQKLQKELHKDVAQFECLKEN